MIKVNPSSINDLVALKDAGIPVTLTSHPGNASLYKLVLWSCGIPEHLWDVTCCKADANNWPMHRLIDGRAELMIADDQHRTIMTRTNADNRFVTAYQRTREGMRLGRYHVRAMQQQFASVISSCSRLLLSERDKVWEVFNYLAHTRSHIVFSRAITSDGVMRPIRECGIPVDGMATSFIGLLEELDHLLFSDEEIVTKGGVCYGGAMVQLACMLVQYWQTGRADRYDISGPDMIHYATKPEYQGELSEMLAHLRAWNPRLIPEHILVHLFPGTEARVGYIPGHVSEEVMQRRSWMLQNATRLSRLQKERIWEMAKEDERSWPIRIDPSDSPYFSQYDLGALGRNIVVDEFWRDMPIAGMGQVLSRANNLLRL